MHLNEVFTCLSAFLIGGINMSKKYNRDSFETNNTAMIYMVSGANQSNDDVNTNATKHYDR